MQNRRAFVLRTLVLLSLGVATIAAVMVTAFVVGERNRTYSQALNRALDAKIAIANVLDDLRDVETGQRGYLLTRDERFLEPYYAGLKRSDAHVAAMDEKLAGLASPAEIAALKSDAQARQAIAGANLDLARQGRMTEAINGLQVRGKIVMDRARARIAVLDRRFTEAERENLAKVQSTSLILRIVTLLGAIGVMVFGAATLLAVRRYISDLFNAREALAALNSELDERVRVRTRDLTRANEEIQRFAYIVSHDLRAPLVNIMGFTSELEHSFDEVRRGVPVLAGKKWQSEAATPLRTAVDVDVPEAIGFIRSSTRKMDGLINAILKLSREGARVLAPETVPLQALLEQAAQALGHQLQDKGVDFAIEGALPEVICDRLALEQIFGNVLDNAVKYLRPGRPGVIRVRGGLRGDRAIVEIEDNGRGVGPADRERVFELFRRAGTQDQPGEGIGLAHTRALVRRLGGDIELESDGTSGSLFRVVLPRRMPMNGKEG